MTAGSAIMGPVGSQPSTDISQYCWDGESVCWIYLDLKGEVCELEDLPLS